MDKIKTILNTAKEQTSLGLGLISLLTAGSEQIFSKVVFQCPCDQLNFLYGVVFLLVPALALITLGFILSKKTWKLVTGLCRREEKVCGSCSRVKSLANVIFQISTFVFLAPSTWIAVALLNGVYIQCAMTGTNMTMFNDHLCKRTEMEADCLKELHTFPCGIDGKVPKDERDEVLLKLRAESQIAGWLLIATMILFYLAFSCVARCCSPVSYLELKFWKLYAQKEDTAFNLYSVEHAEKLAKCSVTSFFTNTEPDSVQTPSNEDWQEISSVYVPCDTKGRQYYSALHGFMRPKSGRVYVPPITEGDMSPCPQSRDDEEEKL
ncbi:hypothetical protein NL108_018404 [Boleophthalmus pectinirostris]|uniref:calcium homeostasis modulator protein 6-like n=1 Tax=Boleophthalmus pectinirostris TaxID=150288 RepID=UPI00242DFF87|nr:calcium homeostasis modulator protein 6-like [Boleophthalmus pectinirostris]KAJ0065778.1 hypothetical protein NL108_018404 [Boleophthalmus pectinirostris]